MIIKLDEEQQEVVGDIYDNDTQLKGPGVGDRGL